MRTTDEPAPTREATATGTPVYTCGACGSQASYAGTCCGQPMTQ